MHSNTNVFAIVQGKGEASREGRAEGSDSLARYQEPRSPELHAKKPDHGDVCLPDPTELRSGGPRPRIVLVEGYIRVGKSFKANRITAADASASG